MAGSDNNSGDSSLAALASIEAATKKAKPGDRIMLADGSYRPLKLGGLVYNDALPLVGWTAEARSGMACRQELTRDGLPGLFGAVGPSTGRHRCLDSSRLQRLVCFCA